MSSRFVRISCDGEPPEVHAAGDTGGDYMTLCGLDGGMTTDVQEKLPTVASDKITCRQCIATIRLANTLGERDIARPQQAPRTVLSKDEWHQGDGRHVAYCMTCGADTFNGIRHMCPRRIKPRVIQFIIAAKKYRDARVALRTASAGTVHHARCAKEESAAFETLAHALADIDHGTTIQILEDGIDRKLRRIREKKTKGQK